jgi:hypothetical protein
MATLRVGILRAETIVGIADQRGSYGGSNEGIARQRIDPVGCAGTSGMIMSDGLGIGRILSHLNDDSRGTQAKNGGPRGGRGLYRS